MGRRSELGRSLTHAKPWLIIFPTSVRVASWHQADCWRERPSVGQRNPQGSLTGTPIGEFFAKGITSMRRRTLSARARRRLLRDLEGIRLSSLEGQGSKTCVAVLGRAEWNWLKSMRPGDMFLLPNFRPLPSVRGLDFIAVLACPRCGTSGLITALQYSGAVPGTCASRFCSCRFRIDIQRSFVHLIDN